MRSLWLQEALRGTETRPPLEGQVSADVAIVGGGFTGLWTALHIKAERPDARVVVIEQDVCGGGASGRNAGYVLDWWTKLPSFLGKLPTDEALALVKASEAAIEAVGQLCADQGLAAANFERAGWLWTANNAAQVGSWESSLALISRHGGADRFRRVDAQESVRLGGSPRFLGGIVQQNTAVVQPAILARGLMRTALEQGVEIFERTPMTKIDTKATPVRLSTPAGTLTAPKVVLAMNAWLIRFPQVARSMVVVGSDIATTEPIPSRLEGLGWESRCGTTDSRTIVQFGRRLVDGRVMFGLAATTMFPGTRGKELFAGTVTAARMRRMQDAYEAWYPQLATVPLTTSWAGPVDRSWSGIPFVGHIDDNPAVAYVAGYSGNGVGPAHVAGRMLSSIMLEKDDDWAALGRALPPLGGAPPEPFRYVGGRLVRAAVLRREAAEDRGGRTDRVTEAIAKLAPAGIIPKEAVGGDTPSSPELVETPAGGTRT
jgi:glycine/D-amino acid oxidase-like deaminating enzyme